MIIRLVEKPVGFLIELLKKYKNKTFFRFVWVFIGNHGII